MWRGVYLRQNVEGFFCKMDVISEFASGSAVCAKDCGEIFFTRSWVCNFWMVGVMRDTFLANVFQVVNASLVSLSLRRLEWYRVRRGDD